MRQRWYIVAGAVIAGCLVLLLAWSSVRAGMVAPPDFVLHVGPVRMIGQTTRIALCPQRVPCLIDRPNPVLRLYSLWLYPPPSASGNQTVTRLLTIQIGAGLDG
ncbi:MAG TPA: hypothetical protein VFT66_04460 [Roseiflexaceae bacterium]|nr:hypothetical protein [Roseiflexaceae bacterium]